MIPAGARPSHRAIFGTAPPVKMEPASNPATRGTHGRPKPEKPVRASDVLRRMPFPHVNPGFRLSSVNRDGDRIGVRESVVVERPFCTLRRFEACTAAPKARILIVAPLSGQYATLLRDTVAGLVADHVVYITDWIDARQVPLGAGRFDLDDNIEYVVDFVRPLGPDLHVLGVCQSAVPALAATALLASAGDPAQPRSLILMGGLIDTRINPTRIHRWANLPTFRLLEEQLITYVPVGFPGAMRHVYPAAAQRAGLLAYLARHTQYPGKRYLDPAGFDDPTLAHAEFLRELFTLMDVPAELYLQNIKAVLQYHVLPRGVMNWKGQKVQPEAIQNTALMTVEGEHDDISGPGQTQVAHDLCRGITPGKHHHLVQRGVGHFGMYAGDLWFSHVLPEVNAFIRVQN